jgi:murein DD-endopeptidase MepM/ murein hydrolase activator NlpD
MSEKDAIKPVQTMDIRAVKPAVEDPKKLVESLAAAKDKVSSSPSDSSGSVDTAELSQNSLDELQSEHLKENEVREEAKSEKTDEQKKQDEANLKKAELEMKIAELNKKIEADLKKGDMEAYKKDLLDLQAAQKELDAFGTAAEPDSNPATRCVPGQGNQCATPTFTQLPLAPVGSQQPAGQINGQINPYNGKTVRPLDSYRVTSEYGENRGSYIHNGIDLAAPSGTAIKSVADGVISRVQSDRGGYGNWVEVKHSDGSTTRYAHMSAFGNIKVGQEVGAGSVIGAVGSTGNSTGPHVHFEWRDANGRAVDPRGRMSL